VVKVFEKDEYDRCDPWAKQRAKLMLDEYQWGTVEVRDEDYGYDLILRTPNRVIGVEAQVKRIARTWRDLPDHTKVHLETRRNKRYFLETVFVVLVCINYDPETNPRQNKYAWMVHQRSIRSDRMLQKHTSKAHLLQPGEGREWFYWVPLSECWLLRYPRFGDDPR